MSSLNSRYGALWNIDIWTGILVPAGHECVPGVKLVFDRSLSLPPYMKYRNTIACLTVAYIHSNGYNVSFDVGVNIAQLQQNVLYARFSIFQFHIKAKILISYLLSRTSKFDECDRW